MYATLFTPHRVSITRRRGGGIIKPGVRLAGNNHDLRRTLGRISRETRLGLPRCANRVNKVVDKRPTRAKLEDSRDSNPGGEFRKSDNRPNVYTYSKNSSRPRSYVTFKILSGPISEEPLAIITSETPIMVTPCITSERMTAFKPPCEQKESLTLRCCRYPV